MMRWLVLALAAFVLYKLFTNEKRKREPEDTKTQEQKVASGEMKKDPICGVYVETQDSISVRDGEHIYYFCGYDCRQKFLDQLAGQGRDIPRLNSDDNK